MSISTSPSVGYQQITDLSSATALTVPRGAKWALIVPTAQAVRWRDDGTAPTASAGMPLAADSYFNYTASDLSKIKFIEAASGAELNVTYYA